MEQICGKFEAEQTDLCGKTHRLSIEQVHTGMVVFHKTRGRATIATEIVENNARNLTDSVMAAGLTNPERFEHLVTGGVNNDVPRRLFKTRRDRAAVAMLAAMKVHRFRRNMMRIVHARRERLRKEARAALGLGENLSAQELQSAFDEITETGAGILIAMSLWRH